RGEPVKMSSQSYDTGSPAQIESSQTLRK
ncbi:hypothetical protein SAI_1318, partial [Streptococcus agalactiae H36B]